MDTSGKGGTVKHVIGFLSPSGCRVRAFKAPTPEEKEHSFLWRIEKALPLPGEIGIFDRSHYEDVLVPRVHDLVSRSEVKRRYRQINHFEKSLADDGVTVVKVFLHLSYEEQRARLLARLDDPDKHWKFTTGDIEERALWPDYQKAYELALERCGTDAAPGTWSRRTASGTGTGRSASCSSNTWRRWTRSTRRATSTWRRAGSGCWRPERTRTPPPGREH